jgi:hypothetical protein
VSGSLCKHGRGFIPIVGEPFSGPACYRSDRIFVVLQLAGALDHELEHQAAVLRAAGHPVIPLTLEQPSAVAAQIVCWQVAIAITGAIIGLNPFDEPDTVAMNAYVRRRLAEVTEQTITPPAPEDAALERRMRRLVPAFADAHYVALVGYGLSHPRYAAHLHALRRLLLKSRHIATLIVDPLRDHAYSIQLLHAGRPGGLALALTAAPEADVQVPNEAWSLRDLRQIRAAADTAAWNRMQRPWFQLDLGVDPEETLQRIYHQLATLL